jgi:hypothetical protein
MKALSITCVVLCIIMALPGCSTPETRMVDNQVVRSSFPFILDGKITRSEVLRRLGQPASYFEDGSIFIYWLREDEHGVFKVVSKNITAISLQNRSVIDAFYSTTNELKAAETGYYNLVLVFDNHNTLAEHSLVFIR